MSIIKPIINEDEVRAMHYSLADTQYMNAEMAKKFILMSKWKNKEQISKENIRPIEFIRGKLKNDPENTIPLLREYEFDKYFKYVILLEHKIDNILEKFILLKEDEVFSNILDETMSRNFVKPVLKEFEDSFDLKFSLIRQEGLSEIGNSKYPFIISFYKESKMIAFKYCAVKHFDQYEDHSFYENNCKNAFNWIKSNFSDSIEYYDALPIFKKIFVENYSNESEKNPNDKIENCYFSSMDDMGGSTSMKKNDTSELPILAELKKLALKFKNKYDKELLLNFGIKFISDSLYDKITLMWTRDFNANQPAQITVACENKQKTENTKNQLPKLHFHAVSHLNRARINYVIESIREHI